MSRSFKKTPSFSDYSRNYTRWAKRQASKAVRRYQGELTNGAHYKKVYPTWDIHEYKGVWFEDVKRIDTEHMLFWRKHAWRK